MPAGLVLLPGQRLMTSCGDVLSAKTGDFLTTVTPAVAGDEIWYNPGDNHVYFGNQPMFVVDATSYPVIASIDAGDTHSLAANSENNHIFVPVTGVGVVVYADDEDQEGQGREVGCKAPAPPLVGMPRLMDLMVRPLVKS
jgi:hypothetical protein